MKPNTEIVHDENFAKRVRRQHKARMDKERSNRELQRRAEAFSKHEADALDDAIRSANPGCTRTWPAGAPKR